MSHKDGWTNLHPWVRGNYSISTGIPLFYCKLDLWKCTISGLEYLPPKEGRRWGFWPGISPIHPLTPDSGASPGRHECYAQPGQVPKAANLPLLRPGGHIPFSIGLITWMPSFFPPLAWKTLEHTEKSSRNLPNKPYIIVWKAFLYGTLKCLMRKAVLQSRIALDIITDPQKGTCAIFQTEFVYLYLTSLLMCHLY